MTTYYVRPMQDGTFLVRHGTTLVACYGKWSDMERTLRVMDHERVSWEWEDA